MKKQSYSENYRIIVRYKSQKNGLELNEKNIVHACVLGTRIE